MTPRAALRILDLKPSLSLTQSIIKKAFIKQTLQCHPDLHPTDPHANDKFRALSDALRVALMAIQHQSPLQNKLRRNSSGSRSSRQRQKQRQREEESSESHSHSNVNTSEKYSENVNMNSNHNSSSSYSNVDEDGDDEDGDEMWSDPQHTLEALRNAMLSYRFYHKAHVNTNMHAITHSQSQTKQRHFSVKEQEHEHYHNHNFNGCKAGNNTEHNKATNFSNSGNIHNNNNLRHHVLEQEEVQTNAKDNKRQVHSNTNNGSNQTSGKTRESASAETYTKSHTNSDMREQNEWRKQHYEEEEREEQEEEQEEQEQWQEDNSLFYAPSLEEITHVCRSESQAMYRIRAFCEELPSVLSGHTHNALFEAVAFYHAHHVQTTSECVMRFAKHLPVIVRRVVKNRKRYVKPAFTPRSRGVNTGTRPLEQKIEDMSMKPLVLVGALIFDISKNVHEINETNDNHDARIVISSTCGVNSINEICVTPSLRCIIEPSFSVGDVVERISTWEAASFERLKIELAMVDATSLLTSMFGLSEANKLTMQPHLEHDNKITERVLITVQKLACDMCCCLDENEDHNVFLSDTHDGELAALMLSHTSHQHNKSYEEEKEEQQQQEQEKQQEYTTPSVSSSESSSSCSLLHQIERLLLSSTLETMTTSHLIAVCRRLAQLASPSMSYNITLTWENDSEELLSDDECAAHRTKNCTQSSTFQSVDQEGSQVKEKKKEKKNNTNDNNNNNNNNNSNSNDSESTKTQNAKMEMYTVHRNPYNSTAEMINFTVSVRLTCHLRDLVYRLCKAFQRVIEQTHKARSLLNNVVEIREKVIDEEFIPIVTDVLKEEEEQHEIFEKKSVNNSGMKNNNIECENSNAAEHNNVQITENAQDVWEINTFANASPSEHAAHINNLLNHTDSNNSNNSNNNFNTKLKMESQYRYRPPLHCFPRLYNFDTEMELCFWKYLYEVREYVASHASQIGYYNVFYNCLPYPVNIITTSNNNNSNNANERQCTVSNSNSSSSSSSSINSSESLSRSSATMRVNPITPLHTLGHDETWNHHSTSNENSNNTNINTNTNAQTAANYKPLCGWVSDDGEGGSNVIMAPSALEHADAFRDWLDEIIEQGTLLHTCKRVLREAGVDYMKRAPELPLMHFLSFVNLFVKATAVRALIERNVPVREHKNSNQVRLASSHDVGLTIVVDNYCDVRDGGVLHIP